VALSRFGETEFVPPKSLSCFNGDESVLDFDVGESSKGGGFVDGEIFFTDI
jgi:hypothetical protein